MAGNLYSATLREGNPSTPEINHNVKKHCSNCLDKGSYKVQPGDNFCQNCGRRLDANEENESQAQQLEKNLNSQRESQQIQDQRIANLENQNQALNQQLEAERQAKAEMENRAQQNAIVLQEELKQLREELQETQEKLSQLQGELQVQLEKAPDADTKKAVEQLANAQQELQIVDKSTPSE